MRLPPLYPFLRILTCCSVLSEPVWSQLRESKRQIKGNRYRSTTVTSTAPMNRRRQQRQCDAGCLNEARAVLEPAADTERSRRGLPAPPAASSRPRHASIAKGGRCCPIRRRLGRVAGQRPCRRTEGRGPSANWGGRGSREGAVPAAGMAAAMASAAERAVLVSLERASRA